MLARTGPYDIDAGDVRVDASRNVDPLHLGPVLRIAEHRLGRNLARANDLALVVDVMQEKIQRLDPLAQARFQPTPLGGRDDARNHVERNQPLSSAPASLDPKGDPHPPEPPLPPR